MHSVEVIKNEINAAFAGVTLDGGISMEQARGLDASPGDSLIQFNAMVKDERTDDWRAISTSDLDEFEDTAHLDPKGYRYYIPALMLRLLDNYDSVSMMTISTLSSLYPKKDNREYYEYKYSELTKPQRQAIAKYMEALPTLVDLWGEDKTVAERAYRNYWSRELS